MVGKAGVRVFNVCYILVDEKAERLARKKADLWPIGPSSPMSISATCQNSVTNRGPSEPVEYISYSNLDPGQTTTLIMGSESPGKTGMFTNNKQTLKGVAFTSQYFSTSPACQVERHLGRAAESLGTHSSPGGHWQCMHINKLEDSEALIWPELGGFNM